MRRILLLCFAYVISLCNGDRITEKIYNNIDGSFPCFRKLNGTHQVGCSSPLTGEVGVVHLVNNTKSLEWVVKDGPHSPYVVLLYPTHFNATVMRKLQRSDRVAGVLVLNMTSELSKLERFSPDATCPNHNLGLYSNISNSCETWNEPGEGLLFENFPFPMFYIRDEEEAISILKCYYDFNHPISGEARDWPLCAAQLKAFMAAAVDTPTCLRRSDRFNLEQQRDKVCDPMGDLNLWTSILPSNQSEPYQNNSVVVISARLDAASMFEGLAHGADSAGTGVATFLAVLKQLSSLKDYIKNIENVYFILFHGESFGYIGSSRMVYDMKNGNFPAGIGENDTDVVAKLKLENIKYYIEIGQVGQTDKNAPFYIHETNVKESRKLTEALVEKGTEINLTMKSAVSSKQLPPCSLQSFLKERSSIPGVVITNHDKQFRNQFYNSLFDDNTRLNYKYQQNNSIAAIKIAELSSTIVNVVLKLEGNVDISQVGPDYNMANELLHCYTESGFCDLFERVTWNKRLLTPTTDLYVGVSRHYIPATHLTRALMIYYQGTNVTNVTEESTCVAPDIKTNIYYQWVNGTCYETTVNASKAESPAFIINNYDWKSGQYSTWTESVWREFSVRIFLKPSLTHQVITLVSGFIVLFLSFLIVGWISGKSEMIFPTIPMRPVGMAC